MEQIDERGHVGRRCAAEAAHEQARLAGVTSSSASTSVSGAIRKLRLADQLGEDAAGAEGDERAEDRVLHEPGQQLGAAAQHRLHDTGQPIRSAAARTARLVAEIERDAARLGLVRARQRPT